MSNYMKHQISKMEDIFDIFFNFTLNTLSNLNNKSYSSLPKMHYMKRTVQAEGWKGDYNVFLKREFYYNFYLKNTIPINEIQAKNFIRSNLDQFIEKRNPEKIFTTRLMDKDTENNISLNQYVKSVTTIENNFDKYMERKKLKLNQPNNLYISNLQDEPTGYIANYFILQKTRSIFPMLYLLKESLKNIDINKNTAYFFRKFYNQKIPEIFDTYYSQTYKVNGSVHIRQIYINSTTLLAQNIITIGEINCVNLSIYSSQFEGFKKYSNLEDIDIAAISGDTIYVLIRNYDTTKEQDYLDIINLIGNSWNAFSFHTCFQYLVCPSSCDFKDFLTNSIYDAHIGNYLGMQFDPTMERLLKIEKFLK